MAERDKALVNILERLASEMTQQDEMLEDLLTRQNDLARAVEAAGLHLRGTQADSERSYDKLMNAVSNYRSDMLSLVNEQDRINRNINELQKVLKITTYSIDVTNKMMHEIGDRLSRHEKAAGGHHEYASKQPDILKNAIKDSSRAVARLHADTEKHLTIMQEETARQLEGFQRETSHRLLLLDEIVTSLQTLLLRTEPPERKPLWIVRPLIKLYSSFLPIFRRIMQLMPKRRGK